MEEQKVYVKAWASPEDAIEGKQEKSIIKAVSAEDPPEPEPQPEPELLSEPEVEEDDKKEDKKKKPKKD